MTIALTIATIIGLLLATVAGFVRDLQRALVTLAGTFLGASLVDFWASTWGQYLAKRLGSENISGWTLAVSLTLFLGSVLLIGYGGGALIGPRKPETLIIRRLEAALIGLLNGVLAMGYVVRFVANDRAQRAAIEISPLLRTLYTGLPYLVLIIAATLAVMALVNGSFRLVRRRKLPVPVVTKGSAAPPHPAPAKPAVAAADKQVYQDVLNKIGNQQNQNK